MFEEFEFFPDFRKKPVKSLVVRFADISKNSKGWSNHLFKTFHFTSLGDSCFDDREFVLFMYLPRELRRHTESAQL